MKKTINIIGTITIVVLSLMTSCSKEESNTSSSVHNLHADLWVENVHYNIDKDWSVAFGKSYEDAVKSFGNEEDYNAWLAFPFALNHPYINSYAISDNKKDTLFIYQINTINGGISGGINFKKNNKTYSITPIYSNNKMLNLKLDYYINKSPYYAYHGVRMEFVDSMNIEQDNNVQRKVPVKFSYK
jgi:hypothetical protein